MKTLSVDENNDLFLFRDELAVVDGLAGVMQLCAHAVKAQFREMVLNYDQGVPTRETIWTSNVNAAIFETYLRQAINSVPNVTGIQSLEIEIRDGTAYYIATIQTIYGNGILNNGV